MTALDTEIVACPSCRTCQTCNGEGTVDLGFDMPASVSSVARAYHLLSGEGGWWRLGAIIERLGLSANHSVLGVRMVSRPDLFVAVPDPARSQWATEGSGSRRLYASRLWVDADPERRSTP